MGSRFLYLVATDSFNMKNKKIDLNELVKIIRERKEFTITGDAQNTMDKFHHLKLKNESISFHVSYKGNLMYYVKSIDFFLDIESFKDKFYKDYIKNCLTH